MNEAWAVATHERLQSAWTIVEPTVDVNHSNHLVLCHRPACDHRRINNIFHELLNHQGSQAFLKQRHKMVAVMTT